MQYGAAGTRNLATGLVHLGCSNKRDNTWSGENNKSTEHRKDDKTNQSFLEQTLEKLHSETREEQKQEERRMAVSSEQDKSRGRKEITRRESRNLKLQVEVIEGLTYDTIGTIRTLIALQHIDQRGSWYHKAAETAKSVLSFRQAASRKWINRGIEASKGITWVGNNDRVDTDGVWDEMKIHAWKTKDAIKAAKLLLRRYPPPRSQRKNRTRGRANDRTDVDIVRHSAKQYAKTPKH